MPETQVTPSRHTPSQQAWPARPQVVGSPQRPAVQAAPNRHGVPLVQQASSGSPQPPPPASPLPVQVPPVQVKPRTQAPPAQHGSEEPPHVVGVRHMLALHTRPPAHGSLPAQHGVLALPHGPGPASTAPLRQKPAMHVSAAVEHDGPMVQHAWFRAPHTTGAAWQVPAVHA